MNGEGWLSEKGQETTGNGIEQRQNKNRKGYIIII